MRKILIFGISFLLIGCSNFFSSKSSGESVTLSPNNNITELQKDPVPGTVNGYWVEPMYDTVEVPGQLDPKATYYRSRHRTVGEVRPGRYQRVEFPDAEK